MTVVTTSNGPGLQLHGHVIPEKAIAELRRHAEAELSTARQTLADLEAGAVEVVHQRGMYVVRNVVKVWPR